MFVWVRRWAVRVFPARRVLSTACAALLALVVALPALADPDNPSDQDISNSQADADAKANRVGELTNQLTEAEGRLQQLSDDVATKMELANKARVDLETAAGAATTAEQAARSARAEADAAQQEMDQARGQLDQFAASSYQQGTMIGGITAFFGTSSPENLLQKAELLDTISRSKLGAMDAIERARIEKGNRDSLARKADQEAKIARAAADKAKQDADSARQAAIAARQAQQQSNNQLSADRDVVQGQLNAAQAQVSDLQGQRDRYNAWVAAQQQAEVPSGGGGVSVPAVGSGSVQAVIAKAMAQLGMPYSWGGGNYDGPTIGIRDGGVADSYGDYAKVGFDCSGLMMYSFTAAGVYIPHYSGYQYNQGRKVLLSYIQPGDMLFWGPGGSQHVALYIGNGQMIEAPYSGAAVRIAPVRYGGIQPYAVRLL
ncbi:NlpC/P60 family protein [Pseudonocardiaceae bacterium YIM PH 21723]|nr:NlpC/P60 family protein [Pseudonocardiaceae bacterium YIM PH 21723]